MAENEVLDIKWGQSWRETRRVLSVGITPSVLAETVCGDSRHAVARNLTNALQKGSSLLTILKASQGNPTDMRAAVKTFPGAQLARIAAAACQLSPARDPEEIARITAGMIVDKHTDQVLAMMRTSPEWADEAKRRSAAMALGQRREDWVEALAENIERSLRDEPIKRTRRRSLEERATAPMVVNRSLRPIRREHPNVRKL